MTLFEPKSRATEIIDAADKYVWATEEIKKLEKEFDHEKLIVNDKTLESALDQWIDIEEAKTKNAIEINALTAKQKSAMTGLSLIPNDIIFKYKGYIFLIDPTTKKRVALSEADWKRIEIATAFAEYISQLV